MGVDPHAQGAQVTYYVPRRLAERLEMQSSEQPEAGTVIAVREAAGGSFEYDIQRDSGMQAAHQRPTHAPAQRGPWLITPDDWRLVGVQASTTRASSTRR